VFFSSRRRHTRLVSDWSSDVCSSDLERASGHLAEVQTDYHDPALEAYLTGVVHRAHTAAYGTRARTARWLLAAFGPRYVEAVRRSEERRVGKEGRSGWAREK